MNKQIIGSSITAGVIAGGGALLTAMADGSELSTNSIVAAIIVSLVAAAKDWRSQNAEPPK